MVESWYMPKLPPAAVVAAVVVAAQTHFDRKIHGGRIDQIMDQNHNSFYRVRIQQHRK